MSGPMQELEGRPHPPPPIGRPYPLISPSITRGARVYPPLCGERPGVGPYPTPHGASLSPTQPTQNRRDSVFF